MRLAGFLSSLLVAAPLLLLAQGWAYTPSEYPDVCTNPAVVGQWTMDYATATNRAALDNKRLYVFIVGSTWCPDCNGLEAQVISKPAFQAFMAASDAYWVWLDFPNRKATNSFQYAWLCHTNTGLFTLESAESTLVRNRQVESAYAAFRQYRSPTTINMPTLLVLRPDGSYQGEVTHYRQWTNVTAEVFLSKIERVWNDDAWDVQDNRIPGKSDDAAPTATALTNIVEAVTRQPGHTLSDTDSADWYVFTAQPGLTYTFSAEGHASAGQPQTAAPVLTQALPEAGQASSVIITAVGPVITVEIYTETNAAAQPVASASGLAGTTTTAEWTLNQALPKTCYVKVSGPSSRYDLAYSLARKNAPVGVRFETAAVSVAETVAAATLNVALDAPSAAEGGVRVFFSTWVPASPIPFGTATPGQDYVEVFFSEVIWTRDEALQQVVKQVTVPLVQDLHPEWEGDEQLAVVLEDGLNSAVAPEGGVATVTLRENNAKQAVGAVGFVAQGADAAPFADARKPAALVREGNNLVVWLARAGGADGEVSATVETVGGTALPGVDFAPQSVSVAWPHGVTAAQPVTVTTLASEAYEADRMFTVRITQASPSGTKTGAGAVAVTLRDQRMAQSLNEEAGAALKYSASGAAAWFIGASGELGCAPVPAGKSATLKTSVTGPGRLLFDWSLPAESASGAVVVKVGAETRTLTAADAAGGSELFYVAKAGAQTVTWQVFASGGQPAAVSLSNLVWQPLQKAAAPVPAQNFICTDSPGMMRWAPVDAADEYRVYLGDSSSKLERLAPEETLTVCQIDPCLECILVEEMKHYWRVDSVMRLPGGGEVVVRGDVWPFSIKSWDGPVTELPRFDETEGLQTAASGAYRLVAGVQYALGPFSMFYDCGCGDEVEVEDSDPLTYALTGKLPAGLSMKDLGGATHFVGVPSKVGDYALWVQSHAMIEGERVIGSTFPVAFSVVPLQRAAGQFSGWVSNAADDWKNGSVTLAVGASGKMTAKVEAAGQTYSFSKPAYDAETNGTVYVRLELKGPLSVVGELFTHTLDLAVSMATGEGTGVLTLVEAVKDEAGRIVNGAPATSTVRLFRNNWAEADSAALATAFEGYYTVALPVTGPSDPAPLGSGYLTVTVSANGSVKLAGVLGDGVSASASGVLLHAAPEVPGPDTPVYVWVHLAPSAYKKAGGLSGLLRFARDEASGRYCVVADGQLPFHWWNWNAKSVYDFDLEDDSNGFWSGLEASGGFYDTLMNLQTWYLGRTLAFGAFGGATPAPAGYNGTDDTVSGYTLVDETPEGLQVTVLPQALTVPRKALTLEAGGAIDFDGSVNPCGLTLGYVRATGLMSGGFTLYYQGAASGAAYKTKTCKFKGVLTPLRDKGGAWASSEGQGFYLVPDKTAYTDAAGKAVAYTFNRSYRLTLESADQ